MYQQVKRFDQTKAGNKPLYCLQNTRLGFSIKPKYANATQAWQHTEQHKNRNIPAGLDIPLFYSFTTSNGNEGHINVRLANGKVWSDGTIYASLPAFEAASAPIYLGWGESINDERVIKKEEGDMPTRSEVDAFFLKYHHRHPTQAELTKYTTNRWVTLAKSVLLAQKLEYEKKLAAEAKLLAPGKYRVK